MPNGEKKRKERGGISFHSNSREKKKEKGDVSTIYCTINGGKGGKKKKRGE